MGYYAAVDLHGDNGYYGVADETGPIGSGWVAP